MAHLNALRREAMNAAARKIQRVVRWYFFMLKRKRAAITIQRYWRGERMGWMDRGSGDGMGWDGMGWVKMRCWYVYVGAKLH